MSHATATTTTAWSFRRFVEGLLSKAFSDDIKRLIFLSSLAAYMENVTNPDNHTVNTLNELFSLSKSSAALKLPMQSHSKIWGSFDIRELNSSGIECKNMCELKNRKLTVPQLRIVASRLIRYMPKWLMYSSKENMKKDIFKLMQNIEKLKA